MRRKKILALISVAALSIGLLSGCGCAANTDKTNPSAAQSESAAEQEGTNGQSSGKDDGASAKQDASDKDAADSETQETEVVDEAEIELGNGEASGGM